MKLLFDLEVMEDNRIRAHPSTYLRSREPPQQLAAVREFLAWAESEAVGNTDPRARAEAEIGIMTARRFLEQREGDGPQIITDPRGSDTHD